MGQVTEARGGEAFKSLMMSLRLLLLPEAAVHQARAYLSCCFLFFLSAFLSPSPFLSKKLPLLIFLWLVKSPSSSGVFLHDPFIWKAGKQQKPVDFDSYSWPGSLIPNAKVPTSQTHAHYLTAHCPYNLIFWDFFFFCKDVVQDRLISVKV